MDHQAVKGLHHHPAQKRYQDHSSSDFILIRVLRHGWWHDRNLIHFYRQLCPD